MKDIKFRAWDKLNKEWLFDFRLHPDGTVLPASRKLSGKYHHYEIGTAPLNSIILCQYTNLHDKNGKEIWEGDVVEWIFRNEAVKAEVGFVDGSFIVRFDKNELPLGEYLNQGLRVIGNIYENPNIKSMSQPIPEAEIPMGVSQWRNYGVKWHYYEYFENEVRLKLIGEIEGWLKENVMPSESSGWEYSNRIIYYKLLSDFLNQLKEKK